MRIGCGFDAHRLVENRKLILGGLEIPFDKGLLGHSDADVLTHALMDAILGALGEGDIGRHFPDSEQKYKDVSSIKLLEKVKDIMLTKNLKINNIDLVIIAEKPKLAGYIPEMISILSRTLETDGGRINIKVTTTEGMGFTGRGEGIAAQAVCTIVEKSVLEAETVNKKMEDE